MEPAKSAEQRFRERQELFKKLWAENQWLYVMWGIVIGLLIAAVIGGNESVWNVLVSFAPEFVGLLFVTLVLDRRAEYRERERLKAQLIREMGGPDNSFSLHAAHELQAYEWLQDGSLQRQSFISARLNGAMLRKANLADALMSHVQLRNANLSEAFMPGVDLENADLTGAELFGICLKDAKMKRAKLIGLNASHADFRRAILIMAECRQISLMCTDLSGANLRGVIFEDVDLEGADLTGAIFSPNFKPQNLTLPDRYKWTPETNMSRYTDPKHPDYWREIENDLSPVICPRALCQSQS